MHDTDPAGNRNPRAPLTSLVMFTAPKLALCDAGSGSHPLHQSRASPHYCSSDGMRGRGASITDLSHRASFHSYERTAPSNRGIKHLGACLRCFPYRTGGVVVLPWYSPSLLHHAAFARKIHLSRLFRIVEARPLTGLGCQLTSRFLEVVSCTCRDIGCIMTTCRFYTPVRSPFETVIARPEGIVGGKF